MKRFWLSMIIAVCATAFMPYQDGAFAGKPKDPKAPTTKDLNAEQKPGVQPEAKKEEGPAPTVQLDKAALNNGGKITVTGTAPAGKPVYLEVWSEDKVRVSRFDAEKDKETGKRPYILYMTYEMPAYYRIYVPKEQKEGLDKIKKEGSGWSYSKALKDLGAEVAYSTPGKIKTDRYQATLMGSIVGSRGELLPVMDDKENKRRSMQLVKARFRSPGKVFGPTVEVKPDGTFTAQVNIDEGAAPGKYYIVAVADKNLKSQPAAFENRITFPTVYLTNAGTSMNMIWPFLLALAISTFGVLMGAGGGFMLNPLLVSIWPLPHTVVAGTVMPTVLFSQGSGIYNYSRIKFISWKLGSAVGLATVAGGFIGPKLTELVSLVQYKAYFGWILLILSALMLWQTMPGYLAKNKKEQAILKEFKKRAEEAVLAKSGQ